MAGLYVKDNGTWKLPKSIWVKDGTWKVCSNVYVKENGSWREMIQSVTLSSSKSNFNLYQYVGSPSQAISLIFNIDSNVIISSSGYTGNDRTTAFTVGNFPNGSTVIINNNGYISGGGGEAGIGGRPNINPTAGRNGGYGIVKGGSGYDCTIVNTGTIAGSGGGGGGGKQGVVVDNVIGNGGSGGQGAGITGNGTQGQIGEDGSCMTAPPIAGGGTSCGSKGGNGGNYGEDGEQGGGNGGAGGKGYPAILSNGIEVAVSGTILGGVS